MPVHLGLLGLGAVDGGLPRAQGAGEGGDGLVAALGLLLADRSCQAWLILGGDPVDLPEGLDYRRRTSSEERPSARM